MVPRLGGNDRPDFPKRSTYTLEPGHPTPGLPNLLRPHIALYQGTGILTRFPSATHLCLTLGADSPCADERCAGNLGLSARVPFTPFIATHVSIRTSDTSSTPHDAPSQAYRTLSYHPGIRGQESGISKNPNPGFHLVPVASWRFVRTHRANVSIALL